MPELSFATAKYTVNEDKGTLSIPIIRSGDVGCTVSVICYTRQQTAAVMADYQELVRLMESFDGVVNRLVYSADDCKKLLNYPN